MENEDLGISELAPGSPDDDYVMPFGRYTGSTLDEIASDHEGLLWLDWMVGQPDLRDPLKSILERYVKRPDVAREIEDALDRKDWTSRGLKDPQPKPWWEKKK
jgi:hypothetical protein